MASELQTPPARMPVMYDRRGRVYQPTVGPRLRIVLFLIFLLFALLSANGIYLLSLKVLNALAGPGHEYRNWFYPWMFAAHLGLGFILIVPFVIFIGLHLRGALKRPNRRAVRLGLGLMVTSALLLISGVLLVFFRQRFATGSAEGQIVYWVHVLTPVAVIVLYILHRLAGPRIKWRYAKWWGVGVAILIAGFGYLHYQDPRKWFEVGANEEYFRPSLARTLTEDGRTAFIPAHVLMSDQYCLRCHQDIYAGWFHSAHHFASFNNLAYRQTILDMRKTLDREARQIARAQGIPEDSPEFKTLRATKLQATRWCAGCHDPVPLFSGAFDNDQFFADLELTFPLDGSKWDDPSLQRQPTAHAGITCVSCHAITHVNSVKGNADYTIQEPIHYPFTFSDNPWLQEVNSYLIKAKPDLHKQTFLKPFHRTSEFCATCHKVHLPPEVNDYKWIRGQNHYDSHHNSGASGFGARSFYHPPSAKKCSDCHMPLIDSNDFGNINGKVHNHLFLGANTALPMLRTHFGQRNYLPPIGDEHDVIRLHQEFLRDKKLRVDLFALRGQGDIDGPLQVIRPELPELTPGATYLLEVVVRNLGVGHEFTQGTADSNEVWLHLQLSSNGRVWAESGGMNAGGYVDQEGHFLNALILDRHGGRINRRNAKDIFVPLFNHQIPPSSSQVVHYRLHVPEEQREPVTITVQVKYRKFDRLYQDFFMGRPRQPQAASLFALHPAAGGPLQAAGVLTWAQIHEGDRGPELPVTVMAEDTVTLPVKGGPAAAAGGPKPPEPWERYNDYGIGLFLQGDEGAERGLLKQAEQAFTEVTRLRPDYADGYLNLARVYLKEGRLQDMAWVLAKAAEVQPGYWKTAWLRGELNFRNGRLDEAIEDFRFVLSVKIPERGFDFSFDREIRRRLAETLYQKAQREDDGSPEQQRLLRLAIYELKGTPPAPDLPPLKQAVLAIDPEDRLAHYWLEKCYRQLGEAQAAEQHLSAFRIYEVDNNARDYALRTFRLAHPWADRAAQAIVIYDLKPGPGPTAPLPERNALGPRRPTPPGRRRRDSTG
jgi:tetratricopeptide (TPR) repeat protein